MIERVTLLWAEIAARYEDPGHHLTDALLARIRADWQGMRVCLAVHTAESVERGPVRDPDRVMDRLWEDLWPEHGPALQELMDRTVGIKDDPVVRLRAMADADDATVALWWTAMKASRQVDEEACDDARVEAMIRRMI